MKRLSVYGYLIVMYISLYMRILIEHRVFPKAQAYLPKVILEF